MAGPASPSAKSYADIIAAMKSFGNHPTENGLSAGDLQTFLTGMDTNRAEDSAVSSGCPSDAGASYSGTRCTVHNSSDYTLGFLGISDIYDFITNASRKYTSKGCTSKTENTICYCDVRCSCDTRCACNSRCSCDTRCSCNSNVGCTCDYRCACDNRTGCATNTQCDCNNRTACDCNNGGTGPGFGGSCSSNAGGCYEVSTCSCDNRFIACDCRDRCNCVSRTTDQRACKCQGRTVDDNTICQCDARYNCNCVARSGCDCNNRTHPSGGTACRCRTRTSCYCAVRTGLCQCDSRTNPCNCDARCICDANLDTQSDHDYDSPVGCNCDGRCTCNTVEEYT